MVDRPVITTQSLAVITPMHRYRQRIRRQGTFVSRNPWIHAASLSVNSNHVSARRPSPFTHFLLAHGHGVNAGEQRSQGEFS
jgi:hypothetical protein